jgi:DNA-binding NarL/FixJ family response regulator
MTCEVLDRLDTLERWLHRTLEPGLPLRDPSAPVALWNPGLSPREVELLTYLAAGLSSQEIASHLIISERTVREHVSNVLSKMQVPSRTVVASWALLCGLVEVDDVLALWRQYRPHLMIGETHAARRTD